jgi:hypothetical protein
MTDGAKQLAAYRDAAEKRVNKFMRMVAARESDHPFPQSARGRGWHHEDAALRVVHAG